MTSVADARRNAALEAEAKRLGLSLWQYEMVRAVDTDVIREIVRDQRRAPIVPSSIAGQSTAQSPGRSSGWSNPQPLSPPPGVALADKLMDAQDEIDRRELERWLKR